MKKGIAYIIVVALLLVLFKGCGFSSNEEYNKAAYEYNKSHPNGHQYGYHYDIGGHTYTTTGQ